MTGLQRILKTYGEIKVESNGKKVVWVWDYANDKPMLKSDMTKEMLAESEKARWVDTFNKKDNYEQ